MLKLSIFFLKLYHETPVIRTIRNLDKVCMSDDTIKLANFGYLTKKLQENNIDTNEEELSSLFSQTLKNSTDGTVDINDFTQVLTNIYGIDDSSEILSTLSQMASVNNVENATVNNDLSTENSKEAIAELLEGQLAELESNFETAKSQNGGIGKLWDGIKNLTHIGAGSSKAQDELNNLKQQIEDYKNGKIDLATTYKNITGKDATQDDLNKLLNGEIKLSDVSTASEKIEGYAEGQKMCVDTVADMASGIVSVGVVAFGSAIGICAAPFTAGASLGLVAAGLTMAAGAGAIVKTGIKAADSAVGGREYNLKNAGYDLVTGAANGAMGVFSNGLAGSAGKAVMKAAGMEALETTVVKSAAVAGGKAVVEQAAKNVTFSAGKQMAVKAGAFVVEATIDGGLSGAMDAFSRDVAQNMTNGENEEDKDILEILKDTTSGFVGGAAGGIVIGGAMRGASKLGNLAGETQIGQNAGQAIKKIGGDISETLSDGLDMLGGKAPVVNSIRESLSNFGVTINDKFVATSLKNAVTQVDDNIYSVAVGNYSVQIAKEELSEEIIEAINKGDNSLIFTKAQMVIAEALAEVGETSVIKEVVKEPEMQSDGLLAKIKNKNTAKKMLKKMNLSDDQDLYDYLMNNKNVLEMYRNLSSYSRSSLFNMLKIYKNDKDMLNRLSELSSLKIDCSFDIQGHSLFLDSEHWNMFKDLLNDSRISTAIKEGRLDYEHLIDNCFKYDDLSRYAALMESLTDDQCTSIMNDLPNISADSETFVKYKDLILKMNNSNTELGYADSYAFCYYLLGEDEIDYSALQLLQKREYLRVLNEAQIQLKNICTPEELEQIKLPNKIEQLSKKLTNTIQTTEVDSQAAVGMFKGFFANNNANLDNLLSTADFTRYSKNGIPLEYSRSQFLQDLTDVLKSSTQTEQNEIFNKLGISVIKDETGKIAGYDGVIDLTKLSTDGTDGAVLSLVNRFIKENSVNTGDVEIDNALNSLIQGMPEFINVIGKQQHSTQDLSVDAHILTVLQQAMSNPNYQNLSNQDKFCLKLATIMHDISKSEGIVDGNHPDIAARYARDILNKFNLSNEVKDRVCELIKNHHWLAQYNTGAIDASQVAAQFRRAGDLTIAQIMAEADLKGVKIDGSFYDNYSSALSVENQAPIENRLNRINSTGQMFLTNKVINRNMLPTVEYNGQEYKVIDLTSLSKDFDLSQFGFEGGTTPENLRLFIHAPRDASGLECAYLLRDSNNKGLLSASYISLENNNFFNDCTFALSIEAENVNVVDAASSNISSGYLKTQNNYGFFLGNIEFRSLVSDTIKKELELSDSEYSQLYSIIQKYKYTSQFDNIQEIKVADKTFTGLQIKQAILNADELLITKHRSLHNEVVLNAPKANAVVAKFNKLEDLPQELLAFAQEHNLPIYLLGN